MKVLVTGSSGRLGPYVVAELERAGHDPTLFSRRAPSAALSHLPWVEGDIWSFEDCEKAVRGGFDAIQHLAAQPWPTDHPREQEAAKERGIPFDTTMQSNVMGLYYLLQAALRADVGIFVMTGSNCAPIDETHPPDVEDSYSYSKLTGELLLESYTHAYGMRTYAVRAAGICNEERRRGIAARAAPVAGWSPWLWEWVGSEDVASAHRLLMEKANEIETHGVYFCNADDTTALEPSRELIECFRPDLLPLVRDLDGHGSFLSNRRLQETVGWVHQTSWRQYLKDGEAQP